jgi:MFS transporter, MHS family, proline/betaine transporter
MTVASTARAAARSSSARIITAASIGNALEWFDLLIYGYFAEAFSKLFFPKGDPTIALLLTLGTFGTGYLVRPLGAIVLGTYADRAGRKASLMVSILLMLIGTLMMAVMPTYQSIGLAAPILVFVARLLQGFSVGGAFGSATAFLVEHGEERKGFFASFQWASQGIAAVLASAFGVVLNTLLTADEFASWGWRLPYIFGLLIAPIGFYIRSHVDETPTFLGAEAARAPLRDVLVQQWDRVLLAIGLVIVSTSSNYLILYMPTFAIRQLGLPASTSFIATLLGGVILSTGSPFFGHWSDKVGRTRIMQGATLLFLVSAYPAFVLLTTYPVLATLIAITCWLSLLKTAYSGVLPSLMAEVFPARTRGTGMALSYNISVPIFGGFAPFFAEAAIDFTGDRHAPSFYLVLTAVASLVVLVMVRRRLGLR